MKIGIGICGSFCTFGKLFPVMEKLAQEHQLIPILSDAVQKTDSRFGTAAEHKRQITAICGQAPLTDIAQAEPIGPSQLLDVLVIAPCTGNTLAKLAHGIADGPVTMAVKSHLRNGRPVVIGLSTNDGLGAAAENIGRLLTRKHYYFIPYRQDAPQGKPTSLISDLTYTERTIAAAINGQQLQPLLI